MSEQPAGALFTFTIDASGKVVKYELRELAKGSA